jgi:hypothetical protein
MDQLLRLRQLAVTEDSQRQLKRVQRQAQLKWPFGGIRLESTLKTSPIASVFRGYRGAEPVVVKKFWDRNARGHFVGGTIHALKRFDGLREHRKYSVNKYFASSGMLGLVVVSFEPGTPVDKLLHRRRVNRSDVIRRCCGWLDWAGQDEISATALSAGGFAAEINSILAASADHPDVALLAELGAELLQMLAVFGEQPALRAPGHADFAPRNLILRPDNGVAAIDIHRSGTFYRSRQAAIFLVSKDFRGKGPSGPLIYGLHEAELRQFLACSNTPQEEADSFLVFFIGLTYFRMYARQSKRMRRMRVRHEIIKQYLQDLSQGRRIVP